MIDEFHKKYIQALTRLFDEHKVQYGIPEDKKLVIY